MHRTKPSPNSVPQKPIVPLVRPFQEFAARESSSGLLLLASTVIALVWANSPAAGSYTALWHTRFSVVLGSFALDKELHFWVNDALMTIFFFVVGLEIKRELIAGELASFRHAALPIAAACGGVLVPAMLYGILNRGGPGAAGWGIPMATDIAFSIGVLALLSDRIPLGLKVFLTALAIVDDIAAVLVIALFYTPQVAWMPLAQCAGCLGGLFVLNRLGVRHPLPYLLAGIVLWLAVLQSGVHATIAGILLAITIPSRSGLHRSEFVAHGRILLGDFEKASQAGATIENHEEQEAIVEAVKDACREIQPLSNRLERGLHPWVSFFVMPVFALANAGVAIPKDFSAVLLQPVTIGVIVGLVLGKPLGILAASWLAVRLRLASLPENVTWRHVNGAGWLAGIGFTMSLFVAGLAFTTESLLDMAKLGILIASLCAGIAGALFLITIPAPANRER